MNLIVLLALSVLAVSTVMADDSSSPAAAAIGKDPYYKPIYDIAKAPALFEDFIKKYHRVYKDEADREIHYKAFINSLKEINKFNSMPHGAVFDINEFADYTKEELEKIKGLVIPDDHKKQS